MPGRRARWIRSSPFAGYLAIALRDILGGAPTPPTQAVIDRRPPMSNRNFARRRGPRASSPSMRSDSNGPRNHIASAAGNAIGPRREVDPPAARTPNRALGLSRICSRKEHKGDLPKSSRSALPLLLERHQSIRCRAPRSYPGHCPPRRRPEEGRFRQEPAGRLELSRSRSLEWPTIARPRVETEPAPSRNPCSGDKQPSPSPRE